MKSRNFHEVKMLPVEYFESKPASALSLLRRTGIYGFGVNDAPFITQIQLGSRKFLHPAYDCWKQMIRRCYAAESLNKKPHYAGCTVCLEWRSFSAFNDWWRHHQVDGWQIDKDLLTDELQYSPSTCIFVPKWLNTFLTDARLARGSLKIGVTRDKRSGSYYAYCRSLKDNRQLFLGSFTSEKSAYEAWLAFKLQQAADSKDEMDLIDARIYPRVLQLILNKA